MSNVQKGSIYRARYMRQILTDQTESNYLWLSNSDRCNCPTVTGALLRAYYKARLWYHYEPSQKLKLLKED